MLEKCVLTNLELNWNQRLGHKKTKLNNCHHMLTSSTQLQNRSFHVVERTRTSSKCQKMKNCTCKACKNTVFHCQICKCVRFLLPSSSWLLKLPNNHFQPTTNRWNSRSNLLVFTNQWEAKVKPITSFTLKTRWLHTKQNQYHTRFHKSVWVAS